MSLERAMRKLTLRKEALAELTTDELSAINGAADTRICVTDPCITPPPPTNDLRCTLSLEEGVCS